MIEVLVETEVVQGTSEARRLLAAGSVSINGNKIFENETLEQTILLKKGKNTFVLVR